MIEQPKQIKTEVKKGVDVATRVGVGVTILGAICVAGLIAVSLFNPSTSKEGTGSLINFNIPGSRLHFPLPVASTNTANPNLINLKSTNTNTNTNTNYDYGGVVAATKQEYDLNNFPSQTEISIINPDGNIVVGWPKTTEEPIFFEPAVGDICGNGVQSVVVSAGFVWPVTAKVYVWSANGESVPNFPANLESSVVPFGPVLADMDGNKGLEIIVAANARTTSDKAKIFVYKCDGTLMPGWPQTFDSYAFADTPAVGDVDGDGQNEIVVGSYGKIYAMRKDGSMLPNWPVVLPNNNAVQQHSPVLADFNGDGKLEVVATFSDGSSWNLGIWQSSGSILKQWAIEGHPMHLIVGDFNSDKKIEIILLTPTKINVFDANGVSLPNWPKVLTRGEVPSGAALINFPVLPDDKYENKLVVSVGVYNGLIPTGSKIYAFKADGSVNVGWPIVVDEINPTFPLLGQVDYLSDLGPDLFIKIGADSVTGAHLYGWALPGLYNAKNQLWPIYKHDPQNTKLYNRCADSTIFGECNASKKYCANGALIDKCQVCGCPANYTCQSTGACKSNCYYDKKTGQQICEPNAVE